MLVFDAAVYTLLLFALVFLKDSRRGINLVPFAFVKEYIVNNKPWGLSNIVGNVLMFVPLGSFLAIRKTTVDRAAFQMFAVTLVIEMMQYILHRGISDIDDIILNLSGGMIGFGFYHALSRVKNRDEVLLLLMAIVSVMLIMLLYAMHYGLFGIYIRSFDNYRFVVLDRSRSNPSGTWGALLYRVIPVCACWVTAVRTRECIPCAAKVAILSRKKA